MSTSKVFLVIESRLKKKEQTYIFLQMPTVQYHITLYFLLSHAADLWPGCSHLNPDLGLHGAVEPPRTSAPSLQEVENSER